MIKKNRLVLVKGSILFSALMLVVGLSLIDVVHGASMITVNSTSNVVADDGQCTLREAIAAANGDVASGSSPNECPAGSGPDTIQLQATTYTLGGVDNYWYGPTGLPAITSTITIEGNGAVIDGGGTGFRLFYVGSSGALTLTQMTLQGGLARGGNGGTGIGSGGGAGLGGAIFNQGALVLDSVLLTDNTAQGGDGGDDDGIGEGAGGGGMGGDGGFSNGTWFGGGGGGGFGGNGGNSTGYGGGGGGGFRDIDIGEDNNGDLGGNGGGTSGGAGGDGAPFGGNPGGNALAIGGGGGGAGGNTNESGSNGVDGGDGAIGGGGGGGSVQHSVGGAGGFGGGGGGAGGAGGFGGGGGGVGGADGSGLGGFGGGNGSTTNGWAGGGGGGMGGAIFNDTGTITITNSTFSNNTAHGGDGGNTLNGSASDGGSGYGGALFNRDGDLTISSSSFASNTVTGGLAGTGGTGGGNAGSAEGGGIYSYQSTGTASLILNNTILANTAAGDTDCYNDNGAVSGSTQNLIENNAAAGNACGSPALTSDPALGPLVDNGARDQNNDTFTHALLTGSAAVDAGDNTVCPAFDQRGYPRPGTCDIGAFEMQSFETSNADFTPTMSVANPITGTNVVMTPTTGLPGAISAIHITPVPGGIAAGEADVQWRVNATGGWTELNMALCYADSEIAGIPEETLRPYRWDGSAWQSFTGPFTVDPNGIIAGGCVRLSNVTQLSKWGLCSHPVLNAAKNGNDVVLTWSGAASSYEVHRSTTDAYFTPSPSSQLTITSSAVYTDTTPAAVSFYIVQAVGGCGSGDSNTAAAFSYPITSGPTIKYSAISVPLLVTGTISTADDVAAYINSTNPPTTTNSIRRVARWDAASQGLVIRNVGSPFGTPNFNVAVGDFLLVGAVTNAPPTFAWGGDVPPVGFRQYNLVANGYTGIMLPLDRTDLLTADALASAIGNVTRVARWDAATQGLVIRNVRSPFGTPNFNINIGYPYLVYSTVVQQWP